MGLIEARDLEAIRAGDREGGAWRGMLDAMEAEVRSFAAAFSDDPAALSDWGHRYFCPADGGRLAWDPLSPRRHVCQVCGKAYSGLPYDRVWTTFYRNEAFQTVRKAAALWAARGGRENLAAIESILGFYADRYEDFPLHAKDRLVDTPTPDGAGAGKLMPQGLNEAIVVVRAVHALETAREGLDPAFLRRVEEGLLAPATELLVPQANRIHNIPCWIDAALGAIGLFTGDDYLVAKAMDDPEAGIQAQLRQGFTEDGLWYEGSIHYHYFALEAALSLLVPAARRGIRRLRAESSVLKALEAGWRYSFSSGRFPAPNDGWPDVGLKTYTHVYDLAAALYGPDSSARAMRDALDADPAERTEIPLSRPYYFRDRLSLERLLFSAALPPTGTASRPAAAPRRAPYVFRGSCFAMLRREGLEVFLKYGHNGPSHAHPDKMTIEVALGDSFLTRDLSNAGYGSPLCDAWHRSSPAHNTVVVDGSDHLSTDRGRVLWFDRDRVAARAAEVYPGVAFARTLGLSPGGFTDLFEVEAEGEHVYDWFFHVDGALEAGSAGEGPAGAAAGGGKPAGPASLGFGGPYALLEDLVELPVAPEYELAFVAGGRRARFRAAGEGIRAFIGKSLDNPVDGRRVAIILRASGRKARFDTEWTIEGANP